VSVLVLVELVKMVLRYQVCQKELDVTCMLQL